MCLFTRGLLFVVCRILLLSSSARSTLGGGRRTLLTYLPVSKRFFVPSTVPREKRNRQPFTVNHWPRSRTVVRRTACGGLRVADGERQSSLAARNGQRLPATLKGERGLLPLTIGGHLSSIVERRLAIGDYCSWFVARGSFAMDARDSLLFSRLGCSLLVCPGLLPTLARSTL